MHPKDTALPILFCLVAGFLHVQQSIKRLPKDNGSAYRESNNSQTHHTVFVETTRLNTTNNTDNHNSTEPPNEDNPFLLRVGVMPALDALQSCSPSLNRSVPMLKLRTRENMLNSFPPWRMETPNLRAFWDFIAENQRIPDTKIPSHNCQESNRTARRYRFVQSLRTPSYRGLGARLKIMASSFGYAMMHNMTFTVPGPWLWTDENTCPARDHTCYFQEPHGLNNIKLCSEMNVSSYNNTTKMNGVAVQNEDLHYAHSGVFELGQRFQLSPFRVNCELSFYLMQPNPSLQMDIKEAARSLDWHRLPRPILTVHIRHGKKHQESKYYPTKDYLQAAATMKERHGFRTVFLVTDDREAYETFAKHIPTLGFEAFVSLDSPEHVQKGWSDRLKTELDAHMRVQSGRSSPCYEAVTALLNMYIGAQSDGFVGTFNSNLGRTILKLMYALRGSMPPNVSLDDFFTTKDSGSCWHENICIKRHTILVKTVSDKYPMSTSILE